jgi:hypothetical protein
VAVPAGPRAGSSALWRMRGFRWDTGIDEGTRQRASNGPSRRRFDEAVNDFCG